MKKSLEVTVCCYIVKWPQNLFYTRIEISIDYENYHARNISFIRRTEIEQCIVHWADVLYNHVFLQLGSGWVGGARDGNLHNPFYCPD